MELWREEKIVEEGTQRIEEENRDEE